MDEYVINFWFGSIVMDVKELIVCCVVLEIRCGMLVNLGIGLFSYVVNYLFVDVGVFFQVENGVIGLGVCLFEGMEDINLIDVGGGFVIVVFGVVLIDSVMSFGLIWGGYLDMIVLGGLQVDECGFLVNWMVLGQMVLGMGGVMDLVVGVKQVVVVMLYIVKGCFKIVLECLLLLIVVWWVSLIVMEMVVIWLIEQGFVLLECGLGVSFDQICVVILVWLIVLDYDVLQM